MFIFHSNPDGGKDEVVITWMWSLTAGLREMTPTSEKWCHKSELSERESVIKKVKKVNRATITLSTGFWMATGTKVTSKFLHCNTRFNPIFNLSPLLLSVFYSTRLFGWVLQLCAAPLVILCRHSSKASPKQPKHTRVDFLTWIFQLSACLDESFGSAHHHWWCLGTSFQVTHSSLPSPSAAQCLLALPIWRKKGFPPDKKATPSLLSSSWCKVFICMGGLRMETICSLTGFSPVVVYISTMCSRLPTWLCSLRRPSPNSAICWIWPQGLPGFRLNDDLWRCSSWLK